MTELINKLFVYGLHDTYITKIETNEKQIILTFSDGVYVLDAFGTEKVLTKQNRLIITVKHNFNMNIYDLIDIIFVTKNGRVFLDSEEITSIADKDKLSIHNVYYSRFNSTILFDCGNLNGNYYITMEQCADVEYVFINS